MVSTFCANAPNTSIKKYTRLNALTLNNNTPNAAIPKQLISNLGSVTYCTVLELLTGSSDLSAHATQFPKVNFSVNLNPKSAFTSNVHAVNNSTA